MKRALKVFIIFFGAVLFIGIFLLINAFFGNPISKILAKQAAKKYIEEYYDDQVLVVHEVFYNFKTGEYDVKVHSKVSIDTHFRINTDSFGKVVNDSYIDEVKSGWNTYERIERAYREKVEEVLSSVDFPVESDLRFGTIELLNEHLSPPENEPDYGVKLSELELDREYDILSLAEKCGHIIFYAQDEEVTFEKAAELLVQIKEAFDQKEVPFYGIDFVLENPRDEEGRKTENAFTIRTANFLYEDIDKNNLAERIKENHKTLEKYFKKEDKKLKEMN